MFNELIKYNKNNHFFFTEKDQLGIVCNAPKNGSGVYLVFEIKNNKKELVYIGSSGKVQNSGEIKHRKGGLHDRIVNGKQFGGIKRKISWKQKLIDEKIEVLDIFWYDTMNSDTLDIPVFVESTLLQRFFEKNGYLPRWNKEL